MAEINVKIPDDVFNEMKKSNIDVSRFISNKLRSEVAQFLVIKSITSKSGLTEKDSIELGKKVKKGRFDLLKKQGLI